MQRRVLKGFAAALAFHILGVRCLRINRVRSFFSSWPMCRDTPPHLEVTFNTNNAVTTDWLRKLAQKRRRMARSSQSTRSDAIERVQSVSKASVVYRTGCLGVCTVRP